MTVLDVLTEERSVVEKALEQDAQRFYNDFPSILDGTNGVDLTFGVRVNDDHTTHEPIARLRRSDDGTPEVVLTPKNLHVLANVGHMVVFAFQETADDKVGYTKRHVRKIGRGPEQDLGEMDITPEDFAVLSLIFNAAHGRRSSTN